MILGSEEAELGIIAKYSPVVDLDGTQTVSTTSNDALDKHRWVCINIVLKSNLFLRYLGSRLAILFILERLASSHSPELGRTATKTPLF